MSRTAIRTVIQATMVAIVLGVTGCAALPDPVATYQIENARAAYRAAAASPEVQSRAAVELQVAERSLADAERFHRAQADPAMISHFAYLAAQRARIAIKTAELRAAEAALATSRTGASSGASR